MANGSGTIAALNDAVLVPTDGEAVVSFSLTGTWSATLVLQASVDGTSWTTVNGGVEPPIDSNGLISVPCAGFLAVQLIATAFTSGTIDVAWNNSNVGGSSVTPLMGLAMASAPSYTDGIVSPLGLTLAGDLRVNMSSSVARQVGIVTVDETTGRTTVMKTGTLVTTAVTAGQVILTYTVTAGKTFMLCYWSAGVRMTAASATASIQGVFSLESPAGTALYTQTNTNPTTYATTPTGFTPTDPLPFAAGTVIRVVCTPAATTSMTWIANFGGYEK